MCFIKIFPHPFSKFLSNRIAFTLKSFWIPDLSFSFLYKFIKCTNLLYRNSRINIAAFKILVHYRPGTNNGITADPHIWQNSSICPYKYVVINSDTSYILVEEKPPPEQFLSIICIISWGISDTLAAILTLFPMLINSGYNGTFLDDIVLRSPNSANIFAFLIYALLLRLVHNRNVRHALLKSILNILPGSNPERTARHHRTCVTQHIDDRFYIICSFAHTPHWQHFCCSFPQLGFRLS